MRTLPILVLSCLVTLAGCTTPDAALDASGSGSGDAEPLREAVVLFALDEHVGGENQLDVEDSLVVPAGARVAVIEFDYDVRTDSTLCGDTVSVGAGPLNPSLHLTLSASGNVGSLNKNVDSSGGCTRADNADTHALAGAGGTIDLRVVTENAKGPVRVRVLALPAA